MDDEIKPAVGIGNGLLLSAAIWGVAIAAGFLAFYR